MEKNGKVVVMVRGEDEEEREEEVDKEEKEGGNEEFEEEGSRSGVRGVPFQPVFLFLVLMTRG